MSHPSLSRLQDTVARDLARPADWAAKCVPPAWYGGTLSDAVGGAPTLADLPTPCMTLDEGRLRDNIEGFQAWCDQQGVSAAPHGKTTMAPALWLAQLKAGAWAITVANEAQLRVAVGAGVPRIMLANLLLRAQGLRWLAGELERDPDLEVYAWVDSVEAVALMSAALDGAPGSRSLPVLVEVGRAGGRTGARSREEALVVARAVAAADRLALAEVAGYEGILAHDVDEAGRAIVESFLQDMVEVLGECRPLLQVDEPILTAGGSLWFDRVAAVFGPLMAEGVRVVVRSGAVVVHDDGVYRRDAPAARHVGPSLHAAMHVWARVISRPEPGLALLDAGKRDVPYDIDLPEVQAVRRSEGLTPLAGHVITGTNDQHAYVACPPDSPLRVGDVVRLGLSHPCTAFDKWALIPVLTSADDPDAVVVDVVRTYF